MTDILLVAAPILLLAAAGSIIGLETLTGGAFGALFGWIYLKSGRNLWITVIGHGLLNTFRFILLYTGAA